MRLTLRSSCRWLAQVLLVICVLSFASIRVEAQTPPEPVPDPAAPFFDDSVLHDIRLLINSKDWDTLKEQYLENTYYPADLSWQNFVVRNIGIRSRGTGSRSGVKPGLRVDFDRYATDQKFLGLKSFVLRNNTQDASNVHERLSMLFFRRMGLPAPREAHARLFVNDVFVGVYTIVEAVDQTFLQNTFGEHGGNLYDYEYPATDAPYYFEYRGPDPAGHVPKPFKPETNLNDPRPETFERIAWTIGSTGDQVFRTAIAEFLDVTAFIRHVAVEVFLADQDGFLGNWGMNNFYSYRSAFRALTPIAWDKSQAFVDGPGYPIWHNITDVPAAARNRLFDRFLTFSDLRNLFLDTLVECAQSAREIPVTALPGDTRGWLELEVERMTAQIRAAVLADPLKPYTNADFEAAVEWVRYFARERSNFVNLEVALARAAQ